MLTSYQRMHIGKQLLESVEARYSALGTKAVEIGVLAANLPARSFYEAMGGQLMGERNFDEQGENLPEVVYGWNISGDSG